MTEIDHGYVWQGEVVGRFSSSLEKLDSPEVALSNWVDDLEADFAGSSSAQEIHDEALAIKRFVGPLISVPSMQFARLINLIGRMALASGRREAIDEARYSLPAGRLHLERLRSWPRAAVGLYVDLVLTEAVSLKVLGNFDEALALLSDVIEDPVLSRFRVASDLLPLQRQQAMMRGTFSAHREFALIASVYRDLEVVEYYGSVKRVFEFTLNNGQLVAAERLYPVLLATSERIGDLLTPLAQISLIKNAGQLAAWKGDIDQAEKRLRLARAAALQRGLHGQARQVEAMLAAVAEGERPILETLRF